MRGRIDPAATADDLAAVGGLFREYSEALGEDFCFEGFERELADLPGAYAPPRGRLLLARLAGEPVGCIALRPLGADVCEMKRFYVRPAARGSGLGRTLAEALIAEARAIGYRQMVLDTLEKFAAAIALYRRLGFRPIERYNNSPIRDVVYLGLSLD